MQTPPENLSSPAVVAPGASPRQQILWDDNIVQSIQQLIPHSYNVAPHQEYTKQMTVASTMRVEGDLLRETDYPKAWIKNAIKKNKMGDSEDMREYKRRIKTLLNKKLKQRL